MNVRPPLLPLFAACLAAFSTAAAAQETVPSDAELRSAYCMSVIKADIGLAQQFIAQQDAGSRSATTPEQRQQATNTVAVLREWLTKLNAVLTRLQLYLVPRMGALDPIALTAAMKRGEADVQEVIAATDRCSAKCLPLPGDQPAACNASCIGKDLMTRVSACTAPTWLPF